MISEIRAAINSQIKEIFPDITKRYTDDNVPQNFTAPCFFLSVYDQDYRKRLNNKYNGEISFELRYHSDKGSAAIKSDCLQKQEDLIRGLDMAGKFRILNKKATISDNVLIVTFDVRYSEMISDTPNPMQTLTTNTLI